MSVHTLPARLLTIVIPSASEESVFVGFCRQRQENGFLLRRNDETAPTSRLVSLE